MIKLQKQTKLHGPENGVKGNCYTACIASIVGRPIADFAEFEEAYGLWADSCEEEEPDYKLRTKYIEVLGRMGWIALTIDPGFSWNPHGLVPFGYSIASGPGPRGFDHSCVACNGVVIFDPHPSNDNLVSIDYYEVIHPALFVPGAYGENPDDKPGQGG